MPMPRIIATPCRSPCLPAATTMRALLKRIVNRRPEQRLRAFPKKPDQALRTLPQWLFGYRAMGFLRLEIIS